MGKLLRQRRLEMGLTMKQVADAAGMNLQTYAKKERGLRRTAAPEARRFARVLGCSLEEIVDDPHPPTPLPLTGEGGRGWG